LLDLNTLQEELIKLEEVPEFGQSRRPSAIVKQLESNSGELNSPCPSP
jgi:hypothetical protein